MIGCKCAIYLKIDFVLDRSQFEEPIVKNNLHKQGQGTNQPTNQPKLRRIARQNQQTTAWKSQEQSKTVMQSCAQLENNQMTKSQVNRQTRTINRPSNWGQATHPSAVGSWQNERLIWKRSDRNKPYQEMICKMVNLVTNTRLIEGDTQREWKKSRDTSRADTTDLWRSEEVVLLAKS